MKITDIRKKNDTELKKLAQELGGEVKDFRFGMSGGQKKNIRQARTLKKTIARINTVLREMKK
ncbi:MAG: 50S ribosomal protein L29 [Patescibacteria group bacterium]